MPATPPSWTPASAPALDGKVALVTGATSGIGFHTALALAARGATTILAARDPAKAAGCIARIRARAPGARLAFQPLDLAALASVAACAEAITAAHPHVDILINNGAVMGLPRRETTADGLERQVGVNYLAHFALTARLFAALRAAPGGGRVVSVASLAHRHAALTPGDFLSERAYSPMGAYARSKLAMLMFALELHRRALAHGWGLHSLAAHPGWARTSIIPSGMGGGRPGPRERLIAFGFGLLAQPAAIGALPVLFAAIAPQARDGAYYGPANLGETRGPPAPARIFPNAADVEAAARLWSLSERLTGLAIG